jgi:hypothetical protein
MRIPLPGGLIAQWTAEEAAIAIRDISSALVADLAAPAAGDPLIAAIKMLDQDRIRFCDHVYCLSAGQWDLLSLIIQNDGAIDYAQLGENLWGDDTVPRNRIDQAVHALKRALKEQGLPFTVSGKRQVATLLTTPKKNAKKS